MAMMCMMGTNAVKLFNMFTYEEETSKEKLADAKEKFDQYFKAKSSKSSRRQTFKERRQKSDESLLDFIQEVQQLAVIVGYKLDEDDEEITDVIVRGVANKRV